ncbi:MAG: prepilin-type N-terminal cleavage/methylation domain-containing protein [Burkholderiales bacterium]|nr:prepilin-type N-terminal cleavage/methylation domain-containing protein [Burkholderiales bacterium]
MPTSAPGNPDPPRLHQRGFTLLELMVVVSIVALATAGVSLSLRDTSANLLEREAMRLGALLTATHAQARTAGVPMLWRATPQGFELGGRAHTWLAEGTRARVTTPRAPDTPPDETLTLGPEPMMAPQRLTLSLQGRSVTLATDGLRPFGLAAQP